MPAKAAKLFTTAYLLLMFGVYPFYMQEGYVGIGDAKYQFFFYCSLGMLIIFTVIQCMIGWQFLRNNKGNPVSHGKIIPLRTVTGMFALLFLISTTVSTVFSPFRKDAPLGVSGWNTGLIFWLILCILFFVISVWWDGKRLVWYVAMAASAIVFLLGILDSFSIYFIPLEVRVAGYISTLGNANWFCGYLSVVGTIGVCCFFFQEKSSSIKNINWKRSALGFYTVLAFMVGFCQGSDSVFLWFVSLLFILLWLSAGDKQRLTDWFFLVYLWGMSGQLIGVVRRILPGKYNYSLDNLCGLFTESSITLWIAAVSFCCWGILLMRKKEVPSLGKKEPNRVNDVKISQNNGNRQKVRMRIILAAAVTVGIFAWMVLSVLNTWSSFAGFIENGFFLWNQDWGNGRGAALRAGFLTYADMPVLNKLIGVGPGCFYAQTSSIDALIIDLKNYYGSSRLTNAHCEFVTGLVELGILGTICYFGFYISFLIRAFKKGAKQPALYIPAICIACYLCHNLVSFTQVLSTPFAFLVLAMGESMFQKKEWLSNGKSDHFI